MSPGCAHTCPTASPAAWRPVFIISIISSADFTLLSRVSQSPRKHQAHAPSPLGRRESPRAAWHAPIAGLETGATPRALSVHGSYFYNQYNISLKWLGVFFFFFFFGCKEGGQKKKKGKHNALRAHGINRMVLINVHTSQGREKKCACYTARNSPPLSPALI